MGRVTSKRDLRSDCAEGAATEMVVVVGVIMLNPFPSGRRTRESERVTQSVGPPRNRESVARCRSPKHAGVVGQRPARKRRTAALIDTERVEGGEWRQRCELLAGRRVDVKHDLVHIDFTTANIRTDRRSENQSDTAVRLRVIVLNPNHSRNLLSCQERYACVEKRSRRVKRWQVADRISVVMVADQLLRVDIRLDDNLVRADLHRVGEVGSERVVFRRLKIDEMRAFAVLCASHAITCENTVAVVPNLCLGHQCECATVNIGRWVVGSEVGEPQHRVTHRDFFQRGSERCASQSRKSSLACWMRGGTAGVVVCVQALVQRVSEVTG